MSLVVFAGPSLPKSGRPIADAAEWRPPAEAGDLLRLDLRVGLTVCLIDGYFDHRPAVRHKEILLALSQGARIVGASSMGALRAAEMHRFGMEGAGAIFRAYATGRLTGDDEVALVHAPPEWDWRPLSVPLVEARATLCRARRRRLVSADEARLLLEAARRVHYAERSWAALFEGLPLDQLRADALRALLEAGHVPLKQLDAVAALRLAMAPRPSPAPRPAATSHSSTRSARPTATRSKGIESTNPHSSES